MKCIDLHSHVIPTSIIEAIRREPRHYERDKTSIEGEGRDLKLVRGRKKFSGVLDELPQLKILLSHGGGFLPYQIGRLERGHAVRPETSAITKSHPLDMLKRFYFDALNHNPHALRYLLDIAGSERVVIGTDSPYDMGEEHPLEQLDAVPGLTAAERENVCYRTALRLFGEAL